MRFFATITFNMYPRIISSGSGGCIEIHAPTKEEAERKLRDLVGTKWCSMYDKQDDMHPLDQRILVTIH